MIKNLVLWVGCVILSIVSLIWMFLAIFDASPRAIEIALGVDYTANKAFGGKEDKYISSRCWRNRDQLHYYVLMILINLAFSDMQHCENSFKGEPE